jgi:hypothetical protein
MANKRIFQLPDLSGSINDNDLIVVDKYLGTNGTNNVYSTGYKKYVDIVNDILAKPTNNFTNINTSIGNNTTSITNNANAITTLDNSIPGRITSHTLINPATKFNGFTTIPSNNVWRYSQFFQVQIPTSLVSKAIILVEIKYITYTIDQTGAVGTFKLQERTYVLKKINTTDFSIGGNWTESTKTGGLNTSNISLYLNVSINSGNLLEFRHRAKGFNTNLYHDISVLFYS